MIKKRQAGRKKKQGPGQPGFEPTAENRSQVEKLAGLGLKHEEICLLIINPHSGKPISRPTLAKHFERELETGVLKANAAVTQSLYQNAIKGNATSQIWWTKCRMGWKETVKSEVDSKVEMTEVVVTDEQRVKALEAFLAKVKVKVGG